jgi:hypothetical protein
VKVNRAKLMVSAFRESCSEASSDALTTAEIAVSSAKKIEIQNATANN